MFYARQVIVQRYCEKMWDEARVIENGITYHLLIPATFLLLFLSLSLHDVFRSKLFEIDTFEMIRWRVLLRFFALSLFTSHSNVKKKNYEKKTIENYSKRRFFFSHFLLLLFSLRKQTAVLFRIWLNDLICYLCASSHWIMMKRCAHTRRA